MQNHYLTALINELNGEAEGNVVHARLSQASTEPGHSIGVDPKQVGVEGAHQV